MMKGFPSYHPEGSRSFVRSFAHETKANHNQNEEEGRNGLVWNI
jgi:hypothetical protein